MDSGKVVTIGLATIILLPILFFILASIYSFASESEVTGFCKSVEPQAQETEVLKSANKLWFKRLVINKDKISVYSKGYLGACCNIYLQEKIVKKSEVMCI